MAIAPIITGGFGTFADVYDIPTRGFSIGEALSSHVITIEGMCLTHGTHGVNADSTRKIIATITPGDAGVEYVFEETEVS